MSRTNKHIESAKFNQGLIPYAKTSRGFRSYCARHNWDVGEYRWKKRLLIEKILQKIEDSHYP